MKPSIPKGTRDFSATEIAKRTYIFNTIKSAFEKFGFEPIETPSFEKSETLMGKYGEEGDRLIFKILNSGDYLNKTDYKVFYRIAEIVNFLEKSLEEINNIIVKGKYYPVEDDDFAEWIISQLKIKKLDYSKFFNDDNFVVRKLISFSKESKGNINNLSNHLFVEKVSRQVLEKYLVKLSKDIAPQISEKALRYDLTVPFARYIVQHRNEVTLPFKRYQMQAVWRADRPQKGRFREFYQCDADVVGSQSLWQEVEFVQLYDTVFNTLGLKDISIKINNRKVLAGIAEVIGAQDKLIDFTVALDKLDKIGKEGVIKELQRKEISNVAIEKLEPLFNLSGSNDEKLQKLNNLLLGSEIGLKGVKEMRFVIENIEKLELETANLIPDVTLARGLNYYTGTILEVVADEVAIGSVGGGGRYDDLTSIFGLKDLSGMGISFGLDRIYLVLEELNLFRNLDIPKPKVLFINFGDKEALYAMQSIKQLRLLDISAEFYPDAAKMKKQMSYANKRQIPFVVLAGGNEIANNQFTLKNMTTGEQNLVDFKGLIKIVK